MASNVRLNLQPPCSCCDPKAETNSDFICASNAPAQPRRAHVLLTSTPHPPPAGGCSGLLGGPGPHLLMLPQHRLKFLDAIGWNTSVNHRVAVRAYRPEVADWIYIEFRSDFGKGP